MFLHTFLIISITFRFLINVAPLGVGRKIHLKKVKLLIRILILGVLLNWTKSFYVGVVS